MNSDGSIPVLTVEGDTLAEVWEKSILKTWHEGCRVSTKYDKPGDPPSRDCTMIMTLRHPWQDPLIHKLMPGGIVELEEYVQEVVYGIKDTWQADPDDPTDTRWNYTYHDRWVRYGYRDKQGKHHTVNQLEECINALVKAPNNRRLQMITWRPDLDPHDKHSPCCQSVWVRILDDAEGVGHLNMNVRFRSRDALDAAFMNMFAFIHLQKHIADEVGRRSGKEIRLGRYVDMSDSYHIYGSRHEFFSGFLKKVESSSFEDRVYHYHDETMAEMFREAREREVPAHLSDYAAQHRTGLYER
ncbi:MAG: thymidylate synthase [Fibrobacterota bacterium]